MRMVKTIVTAFLALLMLAGATGSAMAQDSLEDIEGVEKVYSRSFKADMASIMDVENPDAVPSGWFSLETMVLQFDTEAHAAAAGELMMGEEGLAESVDGAETEMQDVELDLDLDYVARTLEQEQDGVTTNLIQVFAHDGEFLYAVVGVTFGEDPVDVAESVITMIKEADVSDDDETYNADGTSEGGLWAKLPTAEDISAEVDGLTGVIDVIYFPEMEGTPAA